MCDDLIDDDGGDYWDGLDWEDWMIIGPLSEEIAREKKEQDRIIEENDTSAREYWDIINSR